MNKTKILFLLQLPPPIHGASAVNLSIKNSVTINKEFDAFYFNISPAKKLSDIGKISVSKVFSFFRIFLKSMYLHLKIKPRLTYITLSPHGLAFYKDGLIAIALKAMGGKLVFHMHGKGIDERIKNSYISKAIYRFVFKGVDVIHLSDLLFSDIENVRDPRTRIVSLNNGIEYDAVNINELKPKIFTFIYLSNFVPAKGTDVFIQAAAIVHRQYPNSFHIKLVGGARDPDYANKLKNLITPELKNVITMLGPLYGEKKNKELLSANVFVLPTKNDCFPLSILEAMASGLAIISTKEGAIPSIVDHGVTGDLIENVSSETLALAMIKHIKDKKYSYSCAAAGNEKYNSKYRMANFENGLINILNTMSR